MILFKKIGEGALLAILCFLLFIIVFENYLQLPSWLYVFGRMHPMFLHFPIVLLLLYFFVLWLPINENNNGYRALGLVAALTAVITTTMGFILSLEESREGNIFSYHKWGGILIAVFASLIYYLDNYFPGKKMVIRPATGLAAILILFTGHWGGRVNSWRKLSFGTFGYRKAKSEFR